jgi:hypothetical protein
MSVDNDKVNETFAMNGVQTVFSVTNMRVLAQDNIKAYVIDNTIPAAPVRTDLVFNTDFTVILVTENSITVTVVDDRDANFELVVYRELEILQDSDYTDYGKFPAETVENDFDIGILIDQQISDLANRSLKFDIDVDLNVVSTIVPAPEADSVLGWNLALDALENQPGLATQVAAANAAAAAALASQVAAAASQAAALASQTAAAASATAAAASATSASASATSASASATAAAASAAAALASETAAAAYASQLTGTSVTSVAIGLGAKVFTTQTGKFFQAGNFLLITSDANPTTNFLHGQVTSYVGTTLTMSITDIGGAGTFADWTIRLSSIAGSDGANSDFLSLSDTPNTYVGQSLKQVRVNAGETALEFATAAAANGGGKTFSTLLMGG